MATYTVTRLIQSAVHLWGACEIDGIAFRPLAPDADDLLVSEHIDAANYRDASKLFDQHLLPVIDAVSLVAGAALMPIGGSTMIEKKRGKYIYLLAINRRESARLNVWPTFNDHLLEDAARVAGRFRRDMHRRSASHYLRQAALAQNLATATFHLLQAVEVLATPAGHTRTNHPKARSLIGGELYDHFFKVDPVLGESRRNAYAHGRLMDEQDLGRRNRELSEHLLNMLRDHFRVSTHSTFTPLRGFKTYESAGYFLEPLSPLALLPDLVQRVISHEIHSGSDPRFVWGAKARRLFREW